jgi:hypothetical protein
MGKLKKFGASLKTGFKKGSKKIYSQAKKQADSYIAGKREEKKGYLLKNVPFLVCVSL